MGEIFLALTIAISAGWLAEQWMTPMPVPVLRRPLQANILHVAVLAIVFGFYFIVVRRPWLAAALTAGLPILLVIINNAKYTHLREPFLASDWSYFVEALRYPNLYLPYFGVMKAVLMLAGFTVLVVAWLLIEKTWSGSLIQTLFLGGGLILLGVGIQRFIFLQWKQPDHRYDAANDVVAWGLMASLVIYRHHSQKKRDKFFSPIQNLLPPTRDSALLPHFISIKLESFFDLARNFPAHASTQLMPHWGAFNREASARGTLIVPAWGANTVRTEFAFLTGLSNAQLGVHQFQPYASTKRMAFPSIAHDLKTLGYQTSFVHPYFKEFYDRKNVIPRLGFDTFIDISEFDTAWHSASSQSLPSERYVSDLSVGLKLIELLQRSSEPYFLHAVTMAGHGPYARKGASPAEVLDKYIQRMIMVDEMIGLLKEQCTALDRPVVLCMFGDHPPILPEVYAWLGMPEGTTDYAIWHSQQLTSSCVSRALRADELGLAMLEVGGFQAGLGT